MKWRTHAETGVLFGIAANVAAAGLGHPLPLVDGFGLTVVAGYCSAIPDVDHHGAKIRYTVPPLRMLYVAIQTLVGLSAGLPRLRKRRFLWWGWCWSPASRGRMRRWMGHRCITHTYLFAFGVGALVHAVVVTPCDWPWWVSAGATLGCLAHLFGDCCTEQGCPLLAPFSWRHWRVAWINTGSPVETLFRMGQGCVGVAGLLYLLASRP